MFLSRTKFLFNIQRKLYKNNALSQFYRKYVTNKSRICIVGAGPAGFYAAQYILKHLDNAHVDIIEKLPVPFGLVRFGVAPDHPEVKNVINTFSKTAENSRLNYFGNISLGVDVTLKELQNEYHAILLSYGAEHDNKLNIPNENSDKVLSAREFVAWYNGLPSFEKLNPDLKNDTVTIIGNGNVAIDAARILLSSIESLKKTDITEYALEKLSQSQIKRIYMIGRRGPLQAAFTIKELREILKLPNTSTVWRKEDFKGIEEKITKLERPRRRLTELMLTSLKTISNDLNSSNKLFLPIFLRSPKCISNHNLVLSINRLENEKAIETSEIETLPTDLIFRSIGYKSLCVDETINFDYQNGLVKNIAGRVLNKLGENSNSNIIKGLYVTGWLSTGPVGVILTTMNNSFSVAEKICHDIKSGEVDTTVNKTGLKWKNYRTVTWEGWKKIDKAEIDKGKKKGKPREKFTDIEEMLQVAGL